MYYKKSIYVDVILPLAHGKITAIAAIRIRNLIVDKLVTYYCAGA